MEIKRWLLGLKTLNYENIAKKVYIIGAGGFGKEVAELIETIYLHDRSVIVGSFLDDNKKLHRTKINGISVISPIKYYEGSNGLYCIIAIGDPATRLKIATKNVFYKYWAFTLIHPKANICQPCTIGKGVVIQAGSNIAVNSEIGDHVHINFNCSIGHDVKIGNYSTISPLCALGGHTILEEGCFLGAGAITYPDVKIGKWSKLGAGSVATKDLKEHTIYIGNPAKPVMRC